MKILPLNIRGAGSQVKTKEICDLIIFHKMDIFCVQETELEKMDTNTCRSLWGMGKFGCIAKASNGRSEGIYSLGFENFIFQVHGRWMGQLL